MKQWRQRVLNGYCGYCGKNPISNKSECNICSEKRRTKQKTAYAVKNGKVQRRKKYQKSAISISEQRRLYISQGLCGRCGKNPLLSDKKTCNQCLARQRELMVKCKDDVYNHYGGYRCACCGETIKQFLSIDHINNDGAIHRRAAFRDKNARNRGGRSIYIWLKNNGYPPGFQVLCMNCNFGKARNNGICPHQAKNTKPTV